MINYSDFDENLPIWKFGEDGRAHLDRPSAYFRDAQLQSKQFASKGIVGYLVRDRWGTIKPMTFKNYQRLKHLVDDHLLTIVDYWRRYDDEYLALNGSDTEMSEVATPLTRDVY